MIKRLETDAAAIVGVVDELPKLKQEVAARTTQVETKMSMELGEMRETLTKRLQAAEKELSAKASSADLRAVSLELEEQVLLTMALHTMAAHRGDSPWLLTMATHRDYSPWLCPPWLHLLWLLLLQAKREEVQRIQEMVERIQR